MSRDGAVVVPAAEFDGPFLLAGAVAGAVGPVILGRTDRPSVTAYQAMTCCSVLGGSGGGGSNARTPAALTSAASAVVSSARHA